MNSAKETMMGELTVEEKKCLVNYCMQPENTWLALAIGEVQPLLTIKMFVPELDKRVQKCLEKHELHWQPEIPEQVEVEGSFPIYMMTMRGIEIKVELWVNSEFDLFVGTRKNEACPPVDTLKDFDFFRDNYIKSCKDWSWSSDPIGAVKDLRTRNAIRCDKIKHYTEFLVRSAVDISRALEA